MFSFTPREQLTAEAKEALDARAAQNWECFYQRHAVKFFKDRHYLEKELPDLTTARTIFEVGCGVGNSVFPLLEVCSREAFIYACDFSDTAVDLVRSHAEYDPQRVHAFVADLTCDDLTASVPPASVEICTMVFVLSAIAPAKMPQAIRTIARTLLPGSGRIYFRDYAEGDLAAARLHKLGRTRRLEANAYCRADGTRTYFFSHKELQELFAAEGFRCDGIRTERRIVANQALQLEMERHWVQATFTYVGSAPDGAAAASRETAGAPPAAYVERGSQNGAVHSAASSAANGTAGGAAGCGSDAAASAATDAAAREAPEAAAQEHEWEGGTEDGVLGSELSDLFHEPVEMQETEEELQPGLVLRLAVMSRQHCHTQSHTALMLWQAARPLAQLLLRCPATLQWATVLELGCGAAGLSAVAASRAARRMVCTDGSPEALRLLARNLSANSAKFLAERVLLRQLAWGDVRHIAALQEEFSAGFDIVVGADVVYAATGIPSLFQSAAAMLSASPWAMLMLCHTARSVSEDVIIGHAGAHGLGLVAWPAEVATAAAALDISGDTAMRLLCFRRTHAM